MKKLLPALFLLATATVAQAEVKTKTVEYKHGDVNLKGFLAWDDAIQGKRPGVLVVHEFWGLNDYARKRAEMLAKMGYVAFAVDMYGEGKATKHPEEAGKWAGMIRKDQAKWLERALIGLKVLEENPLVDNSRLAAIGYCFGGSTVLKLAYGGAPVKAVVSFHGAPVVPTEKEAEAAKAKILICHGAADTFIPEESMQKLRAALEKGKADYEMVYYGNATHSFTVPDAEKSGLPIRYSPEADHRSWHEMQMVFHEVFGPKKK